jgi:hypothetical protein
MQFYYFLGISVMFIMMAVFFLCTIIIRIHEKSMTHNFMQRYEYVLVICFFIFGVMGHIGFIVTLALKFLGKI